MRRLFAVVAALVVAGCQVELEGAKCETDGHCPGDQACGLDGTCSERAAACRDARDTPGVKRCADGVITVFVTTSDPVCGTWEPVETCAEGLVCAEGIAACACAPVADGAFHFDPTRATLPGIEPTGAAEPAACRLATLEDALAQATTAGPGSRVIAAAGAAEYALAAPLEIPAGATLTTSTPTDATRHTLVITALETPATAAVLVHGGATLEGFTIRNDGAMTGNGIAVSCDGGTVPEIRHVQVLARRSDTEALATGIAIGEGCGADVEDLVVTGASVAALSIDAGAGAPPTMISGSTFAQSRTGVVLRSGTLSIDDSRIEANVRRGFWAKRRDGADPLPTIMLAIDTTIFTANGDTGLKLEDLPDGSTVALIGLEIHGNHTTTEDSIHALGRRAGGLVLQGPAPASFALQGSRIYGNDQDQVGLYAPAPWSLSGAAAPPASICSTPNVFACPASGFELIFSYAPGTDASRNVWDIDPPSSDVVNADYGTTCPDPVPSLLPACAR